MPFAHSRARCLYAPVQNKVLPVSPQPLADQFNEGYDEDGFARDDKVLGPNSVGFSWLTRKCYLGIHRHCHMLTASYNGPSNWPVYSTEKPPQL